MNGLRLFELLDQLVSPVDELVFFVQSLCRLLGKSTLFVFVLRASEAKLLGHFVDQPCLRLYWELLHVCIH